MLNAIAIARRRILSFLSGYLQIAKEGILPYPYRFVAVVAMDGTSAVVRGGVIAFLAFFVGVMESSKGRTLPILNITLENNFDSVLIASLVMLLMLLFSAWATFFSAIETRAIGRRFHTELVARVLDNYHLSRAAGRSGEVYNAQAVIEHVTRNALQSGIALEVMIRLIQPLCYAVVALGMLIYFDVLLTMIILPVMTLVVPLVYRISARIQSDAREFYSNEAREMGITIANMVTAMDAASYAGAPDYPFRSTVERSQPLRRYLDGFDNNQLGNDRMNFVMAMFTGCLIAGVMCAFGYYATAGDRSWGAAVAYIGSLVYFANSARSLLVNVTNLNRFYPQVRDLRTFFDDLAFVDRTGAVSAPNVLRFSNTAGGNHSGDLVVAAGDVLYLYEPLDLSRTNFTAITDPLRNAIGNGESLEVAEFAKPAMKPPSVTLREAIATKSSGTGGLDIDAIVKTFGLSDEIEGLSDGIDTILDVDQWAQASPVLKALYRVLPLQVSDGSVVFLDPGIFLPVEETLRKQLLTLLGNKIVVLAGRNDPAQLAELASKVVVIDNDAIVGIGDVAWAAEFASSVSWYRSVQSASAAGGGIDETLMNI
jgi:hypothetical protein